MQQDDRSVEGSSTLVRFGLFELDLESYELRKKGRLVPLRQQAATILGMLVQQPGRLVTRDQIRDKLWGSDTVVEFDQGLNNCIRGIRTALQDQAQSPSYVETLPRRGYRFIAPVETPSSPAPAGPAPPAVPVPAPAARRWWKGSALAAVGLLAVIVLGMTVGRIDPPVASPTDRVRLAVLPFADLSPDAEGAYFSQGLTQEVIGELGRLHPERLGGIARTTVSEYARNGHDIATIGRSLDVDFVLEGSVRRSSGRARITAELIEVPGQTQVWADSWDRELKDLLDVQGELARAVARRVRVSVRPDIEARLSRSRLVDPEAHRLYLQGRYHWNRGDIPGLRRSLELYQQALERQPDHALAWAARAQSYLILGDYVVISRDEAVEHGLAAARRALEIDESLAEAHGSLGVILGSYERHWDEAEQHFERALELNPSYPSAHTWYAHLLRATGRLDEALAEARIARDLDPLSGLIAVNVGFALYYRGDYETARDEFAEQMEMEPDFPPAHLGLGYAQLALGETEAAIASLERGAAGAGGSPLFDATLAHAYAVAGRETHAREVLLRLTNAPVQSPFLISMVHVGLGDREGALRWLETAWRQGDQRARVVAVDPRFDDLRGDPRFDELVARFGLPSGAGNTRPAAARERAAD
jgi:TolB-like protein/DNA-binding winged helix-turn-helix (wHTH) protein/Tfp pilus assembly protein PilF